MRRVLVLLGLGVTPVVGAACGPPHDATTTTQRPLDPVEPAPEARADGRIPSTVVPTAYKVALDVDPTKPRFSGVVQIEVDVTRATRFVVLHARGPRVTTVEAEVGAGPRRRPLQTARASHASEAHDELLLTFPEPLPAGKATLHFTYDAPFDPELAGLYRLQDNGRWYAFSQFEATYARRAFPCFDEPGTKTPFSLSVRVPKGMTAFANTNESGRTDEGTTTRILFDETKPLPPYLVALAVGDLEATPGAPVGSTPIRAITAKGRSSHTKEAIDAARASLVALESYFGIPYPYGKLDLVAVPDFEAGAMENPGLVTFREETLLVDASRGSERSKRALRDLMAHELAHQWFGNLVTASWWDDLWLNEGLATWMERVVLQQTNPEWKVELDTVLEAQDAMDADALRSARAIRQPVTSTEEADEAFDVITYSKGAAVLGMLENRLGKDAFRRGISAYLTANAHRSARAEAFFEALSTSAANDVKSMALPFLDQRGVPLLDWAITCDRTSGAQMSMGVARWFPVGSGDNRDDAPWTDMPVCVREPKGKEPWCSGPVPRSFTSCPAWVHPNASEHGYYRYTLDEKAFRDLTSHRAELDPASRIGVVMNGWANVRAGVLPLKAFVRELPKWDRETDRHVLTALIITLGEIGNALYDDVAPTPFVLFARDRIGAYARALDKMSALDKRLFGERLTAARVDLANDASARATAETFTDGWMRAPESVSPDDAEALVVLASRAGDDARFEALLRTMETAKAPDVRTLALRALAGFDTRELVEKALTLLLGDRIKLQDTHYILEPILARREVRGVAVAWVMVHWDELRKKLPGSQAARLVSILGATCQPEQRARVREFLVPRMNDLEDAGRRFAEEDERARLCGALREKLGDPYASGRPPNARAVSSPPSGGSRQ